MSQWIRVSLTYFLYNFSYCLENPVEPVSPSTAVNQWSEHDTKSSTSKEADVSDVKVITSKTLSTYSDVHELQEIHDVVHSSKTDLNRFVEDLLFSTGQDSIFHEDIEVEVTKKNTKRMRKSIYQVKILEAEYKITQDWNKDDIIEISKKSGLTHYQVYKWFWDQQRKRGIKPSSW